MAEPTPEALAARIAPAGIVVGRFGDSDADIVAHGGLEPSARTEIASITKLFTSRLLAILADEGVVRPDEPAVDCLGPEYRLSRRVTLERLARHRSGLPRLPRRAWRHAYAHREDPYRDITTEDLRDSLPPRLPRPRWFRYSNFGAALLGQALATRSGTPWIDLVGNRITGPLGMTETGLGDPVAQPHTPEGKPVPAWTFDAVAPAGALRSTAADLIAFARATESHHLGWMPGGAVRWHNGGTGGSASFLAWDPERRTGVVVLCNASAHGPITALGRRLAGD